MKPPCRFQIGNRRSKIENPQSAFTLIEVLLAIGILAIGCSAVLFLFTMGARSHRRAVDRTRAALLADAVINQVRADFASSQPTRYTVDSKDARTIRPIQGATHADFPEFTYDVTFTLLYQGDYYIVRVTVRWGDASVAPTDRTAETFETLIRRKNL